ALPTSSSTPTASTSPPAAATPSSASGAPPTASSSRSWASRAAGSSRTGSTPSRSPPTAAGSPPPTWPALFRSGRSAPPDAAPARRLSLLAALLVGAVGLLRAEPVAPKDTVKLFNGKDLTGLTTWLKDTKREDPRKVFRVEEGLLRITGDGFGYVATEKEYR